MAWNRNRLALIVAVDNNRCIGKGGKLPWNHPEDLAWFKSKTVGHAVIMGRRTHQSIGRPLPARKNLVISSTIKGGCGVEVVPDLASALNHVSEQDDMPFVIGGSTVYAEALPMATDLFITTVSMNVADGDAFFPLWDRRKWSQVQKIQGDHPDLTFEHVVRRT